VNVNSVSKKLTVSINYISEFTCFIEPYNSLKQQSVSFWEKHHNVHLTYFTYLKLYPKLCTKSQVMISLTCRQSSRIVLLRHRCQKRVKYKTLATSAFSVFSFQTMIFNSSRNCTICHSRRFIRNQSAAVEIVTITNRASRSATREEARSWRREWAGEAPRRIKLPHGCYKRNIWANGNHVLPYLPFT